MFDHIHSWFKSAFVLTIVNDYQEISPNIAINLPSQMVRNPRKTITATEKVLQCILPKWSLDLQMETNKKLK